MLSHSSTCYSWLNVLDLSASVHGRTSPGRACGPWSASTLKEETAKCMDGWWLLRLGRWRNALHSPLAIGSSCELTNVLEVLATSLCRDRRAKRLLLGCSKSGMTCLSLKTNASWSRSKSERVSDPVPSSFLEWCYCHPTEVVFENLRLSHRTCYTSTYCFPILTILNNILVFPVKTWVNVTYL